MGKLDNPLIVHKESDASYEDDTANFEMEKTHNDEAKPTLARHRFKKEEKKRGGAFAVLLLVLVICAGVFAGLYYSGNLPFGKEEETTTKVTTTEATTTIQQKYEGTIVFKGTYIFIDGEEVNGIEGMMDELKYLDPSPTKYEFIFENVDDKFYNYDVLPVLTDLGFYGKETKTKTVKKTGLMSSKEATAPAATTAPQTSNN